MTIRAASEADAEALRRIYEPYVSGSTATFEEEPPTAIEWGRRLAEGLERGPWLVHEGPDGVTGYAYAAPWRARSAYRRTVETSVYVDRAHVGRGVGEALVRALLERLVERDVHAVLAGIALPNPPSVALHERLGFRRVALLREVGWKLGRWVDVGYWQRIL